MFIKKKVSLSAEWLRKVQSMWRVSKSSNGVILMTADFDEVASFCESEGLHFPNILTILAGNVGVDTSNDVYWESKSRYYALMGYIELVRGEGARYPFMSVDASSSVTEALSLHIDTVGDKGRLAYTIFKSRTLHILDSKSEKWLRIRARKELRKGRGFREEFLLNCYGFLKPIVVLVRDIPNSDSLMEPRFNPYWEHFIGLADRFTPDVHSNKRDMVHALIFSMYKTFELSDTPTWVTLTRDIALLFLNTDIVGVQSEDIKLPMPTINIEVPSGVFSEKHLGEVEEVRMISVFKEEAVEDSAGRVADMLTYIAHTSTTSSAIVSCTMSKSELGDGEFIPASSEKFDNDFKTFILGEECSAKEYSMKIGALVVCTILYMNSDNADVKKSSAVVERKHKKGSKGKQVLSRYQEWVVGSSVNLDNTTRQHLKSSTSGRKMTYAWTVRGHFAKRACGKGRVDRRRVWIRPQVRGRDLAKRIISHTYKPSAPVTE